MNALQISLLFVILFQGTWARPKNPIDERYHYHMKSGKSSLQEKSEKAIGQANEECECAAYVFEHQYYIGRRLIIRQQNANFSNDFFHNRADSVKIIGTCIWLFYEGSNFKGTHYLLDKRAYSTADEWQGHTDKLVSARVLPPWGTEAIALFEHENYDGRMVVLKDSDRNLPCIEFDNKISSYIITGGAWELYEHPYFGGKLQRVIGPKECPNINNIGFGESISSVKKINGGRASVMEETEEERSHDEDWSRD